LFIFIIYRREIRSAHPGFFHLDFNKSPFIMTDNNQVLLKAGKGDFLWVLGDLYTFKVTGKETNGASLQ
ncbi:MAG: hypothetical protein WA874_02025, partial [Chryseosolibacter sp.]